MWFEDEEITGRRLPAGRRGRGTSVLSVGLANESRKHGTAQRTAVIVLVGVAAAGGALLAYLGLRAAGRSLFSENPAFAITRIDVKAGNDASRKLAKEYTRLAEGMNIFAFNIRDVREFVLRRAHGFKAISISRRLPGTVEVEVVERMPLARLGPQGNLVADSEGKVFALTAGAAALPLILGYPNAQLQPGLNLAGASAAALQVLELCSDPRVYLDIESIRIDRPGRLVLTITSAGARKEVENFAWAGMGQRTPGSREALRQKVLLLKQALDKPQSRQLTKMDATFEDRIYGR